MNKTCVIIPQVKNNEGVLVDSILFTELLSIFNDRETAKTYYQISKKLVLPDVDINGEITSKALIELIEDVPKVQLLETVNTVTNDIIEYMKDNEIYSYGVTVNNIVDKIKELNSKFKVTAKLIRGNKRYFLNIKEGLEEVIDTFKPIEFDNFRKNTKTAKDAIQYVLLNSDDVLLKKAAQVVLSNIDKLPNQNFIIDSFNSLNLNDETDDNIGFYNTKTGEVIINSDLQSVVSKDKIHRTIVHEYYHALTASAILNPSTETDKEFKETIDRIYNSVKGSIMMNDYGLTNPAEFISEFIANRNFRNELQLKKPSLVDKIISAIYRFLGLDSKKILTKPELFNYIIDFANNSKPELLKDSTVMYNKSSRSRGVVDEINKYVTALNKRKGYTVTPKEKLYLQIHKNAKYDIGKLNKRISELKNQIKNLNREFKESIQDIIEGYIAYNGANDGGYVNNPDYIRLKTELDNQLYVLEFDINTLTAEKNSLNSLLTDLSDTNNLNLLSENELNYIKIINKFLDDISEREYDLENETDLKQLEEDYNLLNTIVRTGGKGAERAFDLREKLMVHIGVIIPKLGNTYLNLEGYHKPEVDINDFLNTEDDIMFLEHFFTGFGDYPRLEAQLIHAITIDGKVKARAKAKETANNIVKHSEALKKWAKKYGYTNALGQGSLRKVYQLLTEQTTRNTLDLTKPYTTEYYNLVNKHFKTISALDSNKKVTKQDKQEAWKWINDYYKKDPLTSRYINPKYAYIQAHQPLREFYEYFQEEVRKGYERLPDYINLTNNEKIPTLMRESVFETFSLRKGNIMNSLYEIVKTFLFGSGTTLMYSEDGNRDSKIKISELSKDTIKIRMIGEVEANKKSRDLLMVLYEFSSFTSDYEEMNKVLPRIRMIQNVVESKQYAENNIQSSIRETKLINGSETRLYKAINTYIESKVVGEKEKGSGHLKWMDQVVYDNEGNEIGKREYYISDMVKALIKYTRVLRLGYSPLSSTANVMAGLINDIAEAHGGEYFNKRALVKAMGIYIKASTSRRFLPKRDTKLALLSNYLQPLAELGEYSEKRNIKLYEGTLLGKSVEKLTSEAFILQEWGEDFVQKITMLAYLLHNKTKSGKSYWDTFEVKNGELVWNKEEAGFDFEERFSEIRNKIKAINDKLHGNYSSDNSSVYANTVIYQSLTLFKKWAGAMIQDRVQAKRYSSREGKYIEGRFRVFPRAAKKSVVNLLYGTASLLNLKANTLEKTDRDLTKEEKAALRKTITDLISYMSGMILVSLMMPPPEEDENGKIKGKFWWMPDFVEANISFWDSKEELEEAPYLIKWLNKTFVKLMNRSSDESLQFYTTDTWELISRPALAGTFRELGEWFEAMAQLVDYTMEGDLDSENLRFERGPNEGRLRIIKETEDLIPYWSNFRKLYNQGDEEFHKITR